MLSPLFTEVKLRGMGQSFPGVNPSGNAFMYQAQTPAPAPLLAAPPTPTVSVPPGSTPTLPPSPAPAPASSDGSVASAKFYAGAIALVAFGFAILLPSRK